LRALRTYVSIVDLLVAFPTIRSLSFKSIDAPAPRTNDVTLLVPASVPLAVTVTVPCPTFNAPARTALTARLPAPDLVRARVLLCRLVSASVLADGVTVIVVSLPNRTGTFTVWLPAATLIVA
jgi:hypothetical protein